MRKNTETIKRTIVELKVTYVANDGTVFTDRDECDKYEKTAECVIDGAFSNIKINETYCAGEDMPQIGLDENMIGVEIKNELDLNTVNMWMTYHNAEKSYNIRDDKKHSIPLDSSAIGTVHIFSEYGGDYCYWWGSVDVVKEYFHKRYDALFDALTTPPEKEEE